MYAGLFGTVKDGTIKSLTVAGKVSPSNPQCIVGGIVGYASNAAIENCSNHCSVTGHTADIVGGIAGFNVDDAKSSTAIMLVQFVAPSLSKLAGALWVITLARSPIATTLERSLSLIVRVLAKSLATIMAL